jgi:DnaJ-class molecular chaperone
MAKRDLYDVLGLSKTASADEIKSSYRKLARKFHPDATKNDPKSTERFKEAQDAYDVLSDEKQRKLYDEYGHAGIGAGAASGAGGAEAWEAMRRAQEGRGQPGRGPGRSWQGGPGVSVEDFDLNGADFGSVFEQLFGNGARRDGATTGRTRGRGKPAKGEDIEHPVTLTFEQAARGAHLSLQMNSAGRGKIEVEIPAGVKDGSKIRLRGLGQPGATEPGDLLIVTTVTPHSYFRRENLDVYLDLPISLYEAISGAKVDVPTLDGMRTLTIPPGTSSGAKMRIKGHGIQRGEEKGDQIVVTKVIIPKNLDDEEKKLIQKIADRHPINARADVTW